MCPKTQNLGLSFRRPASRGRLPTRWPLQQRSKIPRGGECVRSTSTFSICGTSFFSVMISEEEERGGGEAGWKAQVKGKEWLKKDDGMMML
mmetsp:Transcript_18571/g.26128  ORF Transcript_18571/g.26128 Transcript_18571/m.26128 type:complete len:91 (-) Transcript_18571:970-1242(-)